MKKNFLNKVAALAMTVCMAVTPAVPVMPVQAKAVTATTKSTVVKKYVKVNKVAPKANKKVRDAFNKLGFKIHVNSTVKNYTGYFNARDRKITLIASDNTVYHELGHFLAFVVGNADQTAAFKKIYNAEKSKVTAFNKAYVTQNASEYFAESYRDYVLNKNTLRSSRPLTFQYIEKALSDLHDMPESRFARMHDSYAKAGIWKN